MYLYRDADLELQLLEPRHAEELFALTDANRAYLRQWLSDHFVDHVVSKISHAR